MNNDTPDTSGLGNTKTNPRSRKWVFTLNNWSNDELEHLKRCLTLKHANFIIGQEIGEQGTPHLQGYMEFINPVYFSSLKSINDRMHLEKARGNKQQNIEYCSKDGVVTSTFPLPRKQRLLNKFNNITWKPWQQEIIDLVQTQPDERTIHWYWEPTGNVGKSFLCKYLACKFDVIIADGKKDNVFNQIKTWMDNNEDKDPTIILLDVPRTSFDFINYGCIEQIKNGLIYSGKYEGGQCIFDNPHVIIFANKLPDITKLSRDRWNIKRI